MSASLIALVGCAPDQDLGGATSAAFPSPYSPAEIRRIDAAIQELEVGMTRENVLTLLGRTQFFKKKVVGLVDASGPWYATREAHFLQPGYSLTLIFDYTHTPVQLVDFVGMGWTRNRLLPNQDGAANRSQPFRVQTNPTSAAAGSGR